MRMGMAAYRGALRGRRAQLDYVNFYAHLHRVVDAKIGRILSALGSADDPESLRSRTVIVRSSDHGEMGLSHGGLRQKMFNVHEDQRPARGLQARGATGRGNEGQPDGPYEFGDSGTL